jgi:hypothetical protein
MSANDLAREIMPFWQPPGFRPMSDGAIEALCNGDAAEDIKSQRADTLLVRIVDGKLLRNA